MKTPGVLVIPFRVKNAVLVSLRVFSLKRSTASVFAIALLKVLSRKKIMTGDVLS